MNPSTKYAIKNNVLQIKSSGIDVSFQWPIAEVTTFNDILVVRVEPDPGACFNENVFGVLINGDISWVIEKRNHVYDDSPYTSIIANDDKVKLFNWDGDELIVEPSNGKIISVGYGK